MDVVHAADAAELEHRLEWLVGRRAGVADQSGDARCDRRSRCRRSSSVHDDGEHPVARASRHTAHRRSGPSVAWTPWRPGRPTTATRSAVSSAARETAWRSSTSGEPVSRLAIEIRIDVDDHGGEGPQERIERRIHGAAAQCHPVGDPPAAQQHRVSAARDLEGAASALRAGSRRSDRCASTSSGMPGMTSPMWWYIARSPRRAPSTRTAAPRSRPSAWHNAMATVVVPTPPDPTTAMRAAAGDAPRRSDLDLTGAAGAVDRHRVSVEPLEQRVQRESVVEHGSAAEGVPVPLHAAIGHHQGGCRRARLRWRSGPCRCPAPGRRAAGRTRGGRSRALRVPRRRSCT